ncbi:MAG: outer membrane protein assembly factor BamC [Cardiobacteriaceae bacterium]|nr:outer membrane protein assembly factor BamC [Cardiobacteriaceae bacterium]
MQKKILSTQIFILTIFALTACSERNPFDNFSRAPDYKTANVGRKIEVPPDLSSQSLGDSLTVSDFTPHSISSYNEYYADRVKRDRRGYIEVLPELYMTRVIEQKGELPYITTAADINAAWRIVKGYWTENGIELKTDNPQIGIMETDWLENKNGKPSTGIGGLVNSLLGFLTDDDRRDRYRLRFARNNQGGTDIAIIYTKSELEKIRDNNLPTYTKQVTGYHWKLSDTENPEMQLEMTRRIALFISGELERGGANIQAPSPEEGQTAPSPARTNTNVGYSRFVQLQDGNPALLIYGTYEQAWRVVGIALDKASFSIEDQDVSSGTYKVRYRPESDSKKKGFFSSLFGRGDQRPSYLIRLADKGTESLVVVQTTDGKTADKREARALLEVISNNK